MHVKLRLGLMTGAAVTIFSVVTGTSFFSVANLIDDQQWLSHSRQVMSEFHTLLFHLSSAAANERGYLLTGEQKFLADYRGQVQLTEESLASIKDLVKDNELQTATMSEMSGLLKQRLKSFDKTVDVSISEGREAAFKRVREEQDSVLAKVHELESSFETEENRLLGERQEELMRSVRSTQLSLIAGCLLSIAFVAVFNYFFGRHILSCIRSLLNAAENAENGRFATITMDAQDEFGELGDAFNHLSLTLDSMDRKLKASEKRNAGWDEHRAEILLEALDQAIKDNQQLSESTQELELPIEAAVQKSGSVFRSTNDVRRLLFTSEENLTSLKQSIEECSEQADRLGGLQSELDNISNALEVISMSVDMTTPEGQPVLGAVMTRLHELSERCHQQRQNIGESFTRIQTLLSRAMLTAHAASGAESTGRQLLEGLNETLESLAQGLDHCKNTAEDMMEAVNGQGELLESCRSAISEITEGTADQVEVMQKLREALSSNTGEIMRLKLGETN